MELTASKAAVVSWLAAEVAVILQTNFDSVAQTALGGARSDELMLLGRQRDTGGAHAVAVCRMQDQRSPAAADIEQTHARFDAKLAADQIQLCGLRIMQGLARVGEIRRGVSHVVVEQQSVEIVGQVVVMGDGRPVAATGVQPARHPRLAGAGFVRGRPVSDPRSGHRRRRCHQSRRPAPGRVRLGARAIGAMPDRPTVVRSRSSRRSATGHGARSCPDRAR